MNIPMKHMNTPRTRSEFEKNAFRLKEDLTTGKLQIPVNANLGLDEIRFLPNGRIDLLSINEFARLTANMSVNEHFNFGEDDSENGDSGG